MRHNRKLDYHNCNPKYRAYRKYIKNKELVKLIDENNRLKKLLEIATKDDTAPYSSRVLRCMSK
jgi:hypothetical protein